MYTRRFLEETILHINKTFKVLYLGGPRQVGKTTLLLHLAERRKMRYVSLDDLTLRRLANTDPDLFLQKYPTPLLIDEVQYAPELFPSLKVNVDQQRKNGQYWLTGSQQFSVLKNVKESLAGRVGIVNLLGFSLAESRHEPRLTKSFTPDRAGTATKSIRAPELFQRILLGSFPALEQHPAPSLNTFYNSYIQTYLDRDLRDIFHVGKISTFHTFLRLCAARTGQLLNLSDLARDAGVSVTTAKEWISILEQSFQIYLLQPYSNNVSKRLIKSPKLYFLDTGLAAFLTKWNTHETLMNGAMAGAFFETYVVIEILKSFLFRGEEPSLYYIRDKEGHEIDLLLEQGGVLHPLEIKLSSRITTSDLHGIKYWQKKIPTVRHGGVIALTQHHLPLDRENAMIPVSLIS